MLQDAEAQLWQSDDWQHGSQAWAGSTAAPQFLDAGGMLHADLALPLDCSLPASCMSQAPLLCSSPPALISTAALLPASPMARPLGMGLPGQLRRFGHSTPFSGGHPAAAEPQPTAPAAPAADGHPTRVAAMHLAYHQGMTMHLESMPSVSSPAGGGGGGGGGDGLGGSPRGAARRLASSRKVPDSSLAEGQPDLHSALARGASCSTSKDSSNTPKAQSGRLPCLVDVPSDAPATPSGCGGTDPLDEVAQLHAQFLTPKHLRKGKGGRQPAVDPRRDPAVHPAKAKRILANRLSAAKSKMKAKSQTEVLKSRQEQLQKQRQAIQEELRTLSCAFHCTTLDHQTLHQHVEALRAHRLNQELLHHQLCAQREMLLAAQQGTDSAPGLTATPERGRAAWVDALERGDHPPAPQPGPHLSGGGADVIAAAPPQPPPHQAGCGSAASLAQASFQQQDMQMSFQPAHGVDMATSQLTTSTMSSSFPATDILSCERGLPMAAAGDGQQLSTQGATALGSTQAPPPALFGGGPQPAGSGALHFGSGSLDTLLGPALSSGTLPVQPPLLQQEPQQQQPIFLPPLPLPPLPLPPLRNRATNDVDDSGAAHFAGGGSHFGAGIGKSAAGATHVQQTWPAAAAGNLLAYNWMEQDNCGAGNESEGGRFRLPF